MLLNHIPIEKSSVLSNVLLPGDPARVDVIGGFLDNFTVLGQKREFRVGKGTYKNIPVMVVSTGIGCPSTAIAVEELIEGGAECLIRVGTCGGAWVPNIKPGSLVLPSACVRDEGTTIEYVPRGFPAVANFDVVKALKKSSIKLQVPGFVGVNRTHDAFYGSQEAIVKWGRYLLDERWMNFDTPILSSDMETAALYVVATLRGAKAGAVLAVNAEPEPLKNRLQFQSQTVVTESGVDVTQKTSEMAIFTALEALVLLN